MILDKTHVQTVGSCEFYVGTYMRVRRQMDTPT